MLWMGWRVVRRGTGLGLCGRGVRGGLLRKLLAKALAVVLASSTFHATLLGLITAHNADGARKIGDAKVKKDREVRSLVTGCKTKVGVVKLVAAVCMDPPCVRALRLCESRPEPGAANSRSEKTSPTVEMALMLQSTPMKSALCCTCEHGVVAKEKSLHQVSWRLYCECGLSRT